MTTETVLNTQMIAIIKIKLNRFYSHTTLSKNLFKGKICLCLAVLVLVGIVGNVSNSFARPLETISLYIPPVGVGLLMVDAANDPSLKKYVKKINIVRWNTPDQLRAGMIDGSIDITFVPSYVGANFYNKGIKFKLANIITGGILYVISTNKSINRVEDLVGKTILIPFQNDMPDLVLQAMIKKLKLSGINIRYVATPNIAVKMALSGKANTLLLPEVAATKVSILAKKNAGIVFYRSIDISQEYGRIFNTKAYIPQAGVAVRQTFYNQNKDFISALHKAMQLSAVKLLQNPKHVIKTANTIWKNQGKIFAKSIKYWNLDVRSSAEVRRDIVKFFIIMHELNPAIIGGNLPPMEFYMQP